ncbi:MAG: two-component regulator propeller domain-containing protein [Bacteroidota bacterium]
MKNNLHIHLCFVLVLLCIRPTVLLAQRFDLPQSFEFYSNSNGLSQGMINAMCQDREGFLWVGTKDGLNRFDGYQFKVFRHDPFDSTSISNNFITAIFQDHKGYLWIGTEEGLNRFDPQMEEFVRMKHSPNQAQSISSNRILYIDENAATQSIWVATDNGLNRLSSSSDRSNTSYDIRRFYQQTNLLSDSHIRHIAFDTPGNLWVSTALGLHRIAQEELMNDQPNVQHIPTTSDSTGLPSVQYCHMNRDANGNFWIGTEKSLSRLLDRPSGPPTFEHSFYGHEERISIRNMTMDQSGNIWITRNEAIGLIYKPAEKTFTPFDERFGNRSSALYYITSVFCDRNNNIWLGTSGYGLYKYNLQKDQFRVITKSNSSDPDLPSSYVSQFCPIPSKGEVLVDMSGTHSYDPQSRTLVYDKRPFTNQEGIEYVPLSESFALIHHIEEKIYDYYNLETGESAQIKKSLNRALQIQSSFVDKDGRVCFVELEHEDIFDRGRYFYNTWDPNSQEIKEFEIQLPDDIYLSRHFGKGHQALDGLVWFPNPAGLIQIDPAKQKCDIYRYNPRKSNSLSQNHVKVVCADPILPRRFLWVGTNGGGINRLNLKEHTFIHYRKRDGLPNNVIYGILPDKNGHLWLSTNMGLSKMNLNAARRATHFQNFDTSDGLPGNEFNTGAFYKSSEGDLYFGGVNGFIHFHPDSLKVQSSNGKIVLTDFQINYKSISHKSPNSPLKQSITYVDRVQLDYWQNAIAMEFASLDLSNTSKQRFIAKLENFESDWTPLRDDHRVVYTNLSPGEYTLRVKASDGNGDWQAEELRLDIDIRYPWWRSNWAYTLYTLLFLGIFWTIRRFRSIRHRLQQEAIIERARAEEKLRQASKLEKAYQELKEKNDEIISAQQQLIRQDKLATLGQLIAGIVHEIKNPLNFVNNFSDVSVELTDELCEELAKLQAHIPAQGYQNLSVIISDIRQNAQDIRGNGIRANNIIHSMMDHARGAEDHMRSVDINHLLDENVKLAYHGYRAIHHTFNITIDKEYAEMLPSVPAFPSDLGRVLLNILNNACFAVHQKQLAQSNGFVPTLKLSTHLVGKDQICIRIRDNGIGISADIRAQIFKPFFTTKPSGKGNTGLGLSISRDIIEQKHHGRLLVDTIAGEFTEFQIYLPQQKIGTS